MRTTAAVEELPALVEFLQRVWQDWALPAAAAFPFELALDEVFMNVVMHGTTPDGSPREVSVLLRHAGSAVTMVMEDDGPPFDPLTLDAPDIDALNQARSRRNARNKNKITSGNHKIPFRICGQSVHPKNPPNENTTPPNTEAARLRPQSRHKKKQNNELIKINSQLTAGFGDTKSDKKEEMKKKSKKSS